jgi:pimeloyl-ACP methyl ester carboxylesterase
MQIKPMRAVPENKTSSPDRDLQPKSSAGETLQLRSHPSASSTTLIYLPGLHGDWTLIGRFRRALAGRVRFVEITYPRTLDWSLEEYASAIGQKLNAEGIASGWLLGESFGSQILWPLLASGKLHVNGVILAGGFVRHPAIWGVRMAQHFARGVSLTLLTRILFGYARVARARYQGVPEVMQEVNDFIARRTELDRHAAVHRLRLLANSNFCSVAQQASVPIYALSGALDPIVPWFWVRRWLRTNCPALKDYRVIWTADHNVLGTGSKEAAEQILEWMGIHR